jgi:hypothetical protein
MRQHCSSIAALGPYGAALGPCPLSPQRLRRHACASGADGYLPTSGVFCQAAVSGAEFDRDPSSRGTASCVGAVTPDLHAARQAQPPTHPRFGRPRGDDAAGTEAVAVRAVRRCGLHGRAVRAPHPRVAGAVHGRDGRRPHQQRRRGTAAVIADRRPSRRAPHRSRLVGGLLFRPNCEAADLGDEPGWPTRAASDKRTLLYLEPGGGMGAVSAPAAAIKAVLDHVVLSVFGRPVERGLVRARPAGQAHRCG